MSADSLQVYRCMNIGTAKPSPETLRRIPHHLIDILDIHETFNVGEFCKRSDECISNIHARGLLPLISGGTAYYMKSWLMGMPRTPAVDIKIRERVTQKWKEETNENLHKELQKIDPQSANRIHTADRYRLLRAIEVYEQTGKPLSEFPPRKTARTDYQYLAIGLQRTRQELAERIEKRIDYMLQAGLENEIRQLRQQGANNSSPGMKGIGYREWFGNTDNPNPTTEEVRTLILRNSIHYAKRQMTFFSSLPKVRWITLSQNNNGTEAILKLLQEFRVGDMT